MALYRFQTVLPMDSGLLADAATNTTYWDCDDLTAVDNVFAVLEEFYQDIGSLLSTNVANTTIRCYAYRMSDPEPRVVVAEALFTGITTGTSAGPTEVAIVLSFQAARVAGLPQARRRGRIYIGPLTQTAFDRPSGAVVTQVVNAGNAMLNYSKLENGYTWAMYSPTDGVGNSVEDGWVDNEWDTQRRRGRKATSRTTYDGS